MKGVEKAAPTVTKTSETLPVAVKSITATQPVISTIKPVVQAYQIQHLPGYQLKSLMSGNPLEKQLSKTGTISTASVDALSKKMSAVEQAVIGKVLAEKFPGQKAIDYNDFRKGVQDELITYDRIPNTGYADYGIDRLGFKEPTIGRPAMERFLQQHPELHGTVDEDGLGISLIDREHRTARHLGPRELHKEFGN